MLSYNTGSKVSDNTLPALYDMQSAVSDDIPSDPKCMMIYALHYLIVRGLQYLLTYRLQCLIIHV
jgi:hypothetical protein